MMNRSLEQRIQDEVKQLTLFIPFMVYGFMLDFTKRLDRFDIPIEIVQRLLILGFLALCLGVIFLMLSLRWIWGIGAAVFGFPICALIVAALT